VHGTPLKMRRSCQSSCLVSGRPDSEAIERPARGRFSGGPPPDRLSHPPDGAGRGVRAGGLPSVPFLRGETVKKKRELFPGPPPASQGSVALPQASPWPGAGILTRFPFDRRRNAGLTQPPPPTASQGGEAREGLPPPGAGREGDTLRDV